MNTNQTYLPHYEAALNPGSGDLKANLLQELREFLNLSEDDATLYKTCQGATQTILEDWRRKKIDAKDESAVTAFYVDTMLYCYELIGLEIDCPLYRQEQLKTLVSLLKSHRVSRGCDYGSGVGTLGIYLNQNGLACDFADVSETNLNFIAQRLKQRAISEPKRINLMHEALPEARYDFITAFDVLEHVSDPLGLMREISQKLNPGGLFIFNLLYHDEDDTPHLLRNPNPIRKNIRGFGLKKVASIGEFKVYQRVARPKLANTVVRSLDTAFWTFRETVQKIKDARRS